MRAWLNIAPEERKKFEKFVEYDKTNEFFIIEATRGKKKGFHNE